MLHYGGPFLVPLFLCAGIHGDHVAKLKIQNLYDYMATRGKAGHQRQERLVRFQNSPLETNQLHQLRTNQLHLTRWLSVKRFKNKFFYVKKPSYIYLISLKIQLFKYIVRWRNWQTHLQEKVGLRLSHPNQRMQHTRLMQL